MFIYQCYLIGMSLLVDDPWAELRELRKKQQGMRLSAWEQRALLVRAAQRRAQRLIGSNKAPQR